MIRLENVLKTSWRCLEDVFTRRLEDVLKTSWRRLCKTSWKRLEDVLKMYSQDEYIGLYQYVFKTSSEDVRLRRTYSSWSRRLEDVFWRRRRKTSSRRLQDVSIKTYVCCNGIFFNLTRNKSEKRKYFFIFIS